LWFRLLPHCFWRLSSQLWRLLLLRLPTWTTLCVCHCSPESKSEISGKGRPSPRGLQSSPNSLWALWSVRRVEHYVPQLPLCWLRTSSETNRTLSDFAISAECRIIADGFGLLPFSLSATAVWLAECSSCRVWGTSFEIGNAVGNAFVESGTLSGDLLSIWFLFLRTVSSFLWRAKKVESLKVVLCSMCHFPETVRLPFPKLRFASFWEKQCWEWFFWRLGVTDCHYFVGKSN